MKRLILIFFLITAPCFGAYSKRLVHVIEQLRECHMAFSESLPMVGGAAVGDGAEPHEFHLLVPYVSHVATQEDLGSMLSDSSPVVRLMAAKCVLQKKDSPLALRAVVAGLRKDPARLYVAAGGCTITVQTVGEVVAELEKNPRFL